MPAVPAHLTQQGSTLRDRTWGQAYRLTESPPDGASVREILRWLDVEKQPRWAPRPGVTYCNVYAHDLCALLGAYVPRVWWTPDALAALERGEDVRPLYGINVFEQSANALFRWLRTHSARFGWRPAVDLDDAQIAANLGRAVVICAAHAVESASGHISVVVAESDECQAVRAPGGAVRVPVQSQAGGRNVEIGALPHPGAWWLSSIFPTWGCWIHDPEAAEAATDPGSPEGKRRSSQRIRVIDPGTGADDFRPQTDARPFLDTLADKEPREE